MTGEEKKEEKFWSVISKSVRLFDRMARVQHMVHLLYRFKTFSPPPSIYKMM